MKIALLTTDNRESFRQYDAPMPSFGTAPEALLQGFAAFPEVEVHVVSCTQRPMRYSPEKLASNIYFHSLPVPKIGWLRTAYSGCILAVRSRLRALRPDIVHGQGTERECSLSAVFSGFPNVLTVHGNMRLVAAVNRAKPFSFEWFAARLESLTLPRSQGVVCITRYTQAAVGRLARRTWVVPNAVDASFFDVTHSATQPPVLICVGFVCHRKNQNRFIRSLDKLANTRKFRVIFLGAVLDDAYGREFQELVSARAWCELHGFADRPRLREWFGQAAMVVLPSLEDNCPMAVLEGMAAGVPVMAANVGGVPDLVEDRVTGVLCNPLDERSMASAVAMLLDDTALAREIAANARKQALDRYTPESVAGRHLKIYREVLAGLS